MGQQIDWSAIQLHGFGEEELRLLKAQWASLSVTSQQPELIEVPSGIVESRNRSSTRGGKWVVGVYDRNGDPVSSSLRVRDSQASPTQRPLCPADISKDPRCAYYLGVDAAHFGHFLLETLCRAWAWPWSDRPPRMIAVIQAAPLRRFARAFLRLIPGLANRVEIVSSTTRFATVLVPSPTFVIGTGAHYVFKELCSRIAERAGANNRPMTDQPVYLSRAGLGSTAKRAIMDEVELEEFLAGQGFRIVRPETLPVAEQVAVVNEHRWIVAPMGSACHTRLFALRPTNLLMISPILHPNYVLCDLLSEGATHYAKLLTASDLEPERRRGHRSVFLERESFVALLKHFGLLRSGSRVCQP